MHGNAFGNRQHDRREIPDGFNSAVDQLIANRLRRIGRNGDNTDLHIVKQAKPPKLFHGIHRLAADAFRRLLFVLIKRCDDLQTVIQKAAVIHQRCSQLARSYQHRLGHALNTQRRCDRTTQRIGLVTCFRFPLPAHKVQILTYQHLAQAKRSRHGGGGNMSALYSSQKLQVNRQPAKSSF